MHRILKYSSGPEKLAGLSRNGPQEDKTLKIIYEAYLFLCALFRV